MKYNDKQVSHTEVSLNVDLFLYFSLAADGINQ